MTPPGRLRVIPSDAYLSVSAGRLHQSRPRARHGARLPFDFPLRSMAEAYGPRASCIVLSGTGADGSLGVAAIQAHGGLANARDPGTPAMRACRQVQSTGHVDHVLPVAGMQAASAARLPPGRQGDGASASDTGGLATIIDVHGRARCHMAVSSFRTSPASCKCATDGVG